MRYPPRVAQITATYSEPTIGLYDAYECNGTFTLTLTSPATRSTGNRYISNTGSGTVTVATAGDSATIGGASTLDVAAGNGVLLVANGLTGSSACWRVIATNSGEASGTGLITIGSIAGGDSSLGITGQATAQGGAILVTGGTSSTTGNAGGAIGFVGGTPGATGIGGAVNLTGGASGASGARDGGAVNVIGGAGDAASTGVGGVATLKGGASGGGSTGNGGAAAVTGGAAASTAGTGGAVNITGGAGTTTGAGGAANVFGGAGGSSGAGGAVNLTGSVSGGANGAGGAVIATSGAGIGSGAGGASTHLAGAGGATGAGGNAVLTAGRGGATSGAAGVTTITAGAGGATPSTVTGGVASLVGGGSGAGSTGNGGDAQVTGGACLATNGSGGSVVLTPGALVGTGMQGGIFIRSSLGQIFHQQPVPVALTDQNNTVTIAQMLSGIIQCTTAQARTLTTPTGAAMSAGCPVSLAVGDAFDMSVQVIGVGADDIVTLTAGDGAVTFSGSTVVGGAAPEGYGQCGRFRFRLASAGVWVGYRIS